MLIIDGHNLIGRTSGLSLEDEEGGREQILRRVGAAKGSGGQQVLVVFGRTACGPPAREIGLCSVPPARPGESSADEALRARQLEEEANELES